MATQELLVEEELLGEQLIGEEAVPGFRPLGAAAHGITMDVKRLSVASGATRAERQLPAEGGDMPDGTPISRPPAPEDATSLLAPLDFRVHVSVRYHARRRAWYDRLHRIMTLVIATGASAGVAAICGGLLREAEFLAVAVAVAGALELALSLPERARVEDALYRRFNALAADIAEARSITDADVRSWEARRLLIRSDADDRLEALRRVCHNLEAEARAYPLEAFYSLWPWQRLCAQIISLPPLRPLRR
jgi:hypothetical protein